MTGRSARPSSWWRGGTPASCRGRRSWPAPPGPAHGLEVEVLDVGAASVVVLDSPAPPATEPATLVVVPAPAEVYRSTGGGVGVSRPILPSVREKAAAHS